MEEEEQVNIKKIITTIDDEKKTYSIDVDGTTTFYEFKKILASAAHLLKNCFRIYHEEKEYTNDYDDDTVQELFRDIDPVPLHIVTDKDIYEFEDELISVRFNIKVPCDIHMGKYKMLYCFTCNKSICSGCISQTHSNHKIAEKADYLAPAQLLMNTIFSDSSLYKADARLSKYLDCTNFRANLNLNIFDNLRKLINALEIKFASCLEFFSTSEDVTEKNTNENLELLKKYCIECFIKLKNDINTKGIIIDDDIFLTLYHKLNEIEKYKTELFQENKQKYEQLNTLLEPFIKQINQIYQELAVTINTYLNKDIYENFQNLIKENIVEKIEKEQVNDMMFSKIEVPRKSLNRMSLGSLFSSRHFGKNKFSSPSKNYQNDNEVNPFPKAINSENRQGQTTEQLLGYNAFSNKKNNNMNNLYKTEKRELTTIQEQKDLSNKAGQGNNFYQNGQIITTTSVISNMNNLSSGNIPLGGVLNNNGRSIEETLNTNISSRNNVPMMKSILNNNSNTKTNMNVNVNTTTTEETSTNINNMNTNNNYLLVNQEHNVKNVGAILPKVHEIQSNITKIETTKTVTTTQNNISSNNFNTNMSSQEVSQYTNSNQQAMAQHSNTQHPSSNIFGGNLVDVLSNEINKSNQELQDKMRNQNIKKEIKSEHLFNQSNGEVITKVTKTQTVEYNNQANNILINPEFLFMYPLPNSNVLLGAMKDESTGRIEIDFKQAFGEKDIQIEEFDEGGAFCNYKKKLYITGGKEKQKGMGKIFLRISFQDKDSKIKLSKMPSMIYSHWNHSMISNENYIFVVGGYNSNKCEYFNLKALKWESMPNLNCEERQRPMLVIHKDYLYAFMGYTQFGILDSIERINISRLGKSKWEKVSIANPGGINLKFYGAGIYKKKDQLYFLGGKVGLGNDDSDYKNEIYCFSFDGMTFTSIDIISFSGKLNFIENEFHVCNDENVGNFIELNEGTLATISIASFSGINK